MPGRGWGCSRPRWRRRCWLRIWESPRRTPPSGGPPHQHAGATFQAGQLVIIDEASLACILSLDRIPQAALEAGTKVLLVGDCTQTQSVDAGGAFILLIHDRDDAPELVDVHRFTHAWEKAASLELRYGRIPVIGTYLDHNRIHDGDAEAMTDAAHIAWRRNRRQEVASVLIAETHENVTALNVRADLILDGTLKPGLEITLSDGSVTIRQPGPGSATVSSCRPTTWLSTSTSATPAPHTGRRASPSTRRTSWSSQRARGRTSMSR